MAKVINYLETKKFKSKEEYLKDLAKRKANALSNETIKFNETNY